MTILPKKKQAKDKTESTTSDHSHSHTHSTVPHTHSPSVVDQRHDNRVTARRPGSPSPRWGSPSPRDDTHDPGGLFEDFTTTHEPGVSAHNKRRHRASPHRNVRKHRAWDSSHPSTSHSHGHSHRHHSNYPSTSQPLNGDASLNTDSIVSELEGYNSGDEYGGPSQVPGNAEQLENWFEEALKKKTGLIVKKMREDGACLFRSVADHVYGDQEMHDIIRQDCVNYMAKNADFFRHYVTEDFESYLERKRNLNSHGNHIEIQAMCEIYNRPIEVYQYSMEPINTFHSSYKTDNEPIRLSYHGSTHYNSLVDPRKATIGVGLGLPGLQPGLAEKNLMHDAVRQSEEYHIESAMLADKLRETDWEVTQESIEEQVARESYLQWLRDQEKNANKQSTNPRGTASATCSSASAAHSLWDGSHGNKSPDSCPARSPCQRSTNNSGENSPSLPDIPEGSEPTQPGECPPLHLTGGSPSKPVDMICPLPADEGALGRPNLDSVMSGMTADMFAYSEWDEDEILAQVMAQSQQEYLDKLKTCAATSSPSSPGSPGGSTSQQHSSHNTPYNRHIQCKNPATNKSTGGKNR